MNEKVLISSSNPDKISRSQKILPVNKNVKYKSKKNKKNYKRKVGKELQNFKKKKLIYVEKYKEQISTASSFEDHSESHHKNKMKFVSNKTKNENKISKKIEASKNLSVSQDYQNNTSCDVFLNNESNIDNKIDCKSSLSRISEILSEKRNHDKKRECPQLVKDYTNRITQFLLLKDPQNKIFRNFIYKQKEITANMRSKLIDWLVDVSLKFNIMDETLFAAVWYLDKYLGNGPQIKKQNFQLIGISCLMIASKFEEVYPPSLLDFVKVCDGAYTIEDIKDCEADIMIQLKFNLAFHSSLLFYKTTCEELEIKGKPFYYGEYLLTNGLLDETISEYSQNVLSEGVCFLLNKMFKLKLDINEKKNISEIKIAAKNLYKFIKKTEKLDLTAVKRKFGKSDKLEVSKVKVERVNKSK